MAITFTEKQIIVRPNNSLSSLDSVKLLVMLAVIALVVALAFVHIGAWLVLPFAGLELLAFTVAFHYLRLHADDYETITVSGDNVVVEKCSRDARSRSEFHRYWARVTLRKQLNGMSDLFIGSHGKEVELGRGYINEEQKVSLAKALKLILQNNY